MPVEDKRSSKCPLGFSVSGKDRWSLNNVILPSEWSENVKWVVWESDYTERNRVIELFNVKKGCRIFVERTNNIKYVPVSYTHLGSPSSNRPIREGTIKTHTLAGS